jgi:putative NADPH-quinone reductase
VRVYIVYCHPDPDSFTAAIRDRAVAALQQSGHELRVSDLYADKFEPSMSLQERLDHHASPDTKPEVAEYCEHLQWCDMLVLVYPTWWSGQPAMLKGWLDRVLIRGVAWELPEGATRITPMLGNVRRLVTVTSHGSKRWVNVLEGEAGRRVIGRGVRVLCHRFARSTWLAMYGVDRSTAAERTAFLDRVERRLSRL